MPYLAREITLVNSCLLFCTSGPFENGVTLKSKEFFPQFKGLSSHRMFVTGLPSLQAEPSPSKCLKYLLTYLLKEIYAHSKFSTVKPPL